MGHAVHTARPGERGVRMSRVQGGPAVDTARSRALAARLVADAGGSMALHLGLVGDRLGLFSALAAGGPVTPGQLAERTGTAERYVRDWCLAMAASGYITYVDG